MILWVRIKTLDRKAEIFLGIMKSFWHRHIKIDYKKFFKNKGDDFFIKIVHRFSQAKANKFKSSIQKSDWAWLRLLFLCFILRIQKREKYALFGSYKEAPEKFQVLKGLIRVVCLIFLGKESIGKAPLLRLPSQKIPRTS